MCILNQKDTIDISWRVWAKRAGQLLGFCVLAWFSVLTTLSLRYTERLLNPPCAAGLDTAPVGFQAVEISISNGLKLRGWWHAPENGAAVVFLGGHGANRDAMLPEARFLATNGYGALTLEGRNCSGEKAGLGAWEVEEFHSALNFVQAQPNITWIAAMGFSAGGSTVLRGAVERPEVRAVIAEGQYANLGEEIIQKVDPLRFSVWWQVKHITALILWAQLGISPWEVSPRDALPKLAPRPVLLIFGENEADRAQASDQFESAQKPKEMWLVPGAGHGDYLHHDPVAYEKRVLDFLERSRSANP